MEPFLYGILMGWGAAIPFGPINLEMTRRNLRYGTLQGIALGTGACLADLIYLVTFSLGALTLMQYPQILRWLGVSGSIVLAFFGIIALRTKDLQDKNSIKRRPLLLDIFGGLVMTLFNPYTLLFWSSLIAQVAVISKAKSGALILTASGVLLGTITWVLFINLLLHFTRHRLPQKAIQSLNLIGGIILLGFAAFGLVRAFF